MTQPQDAQETQGGQESRCPRILTLKVLRICVRIGKWRRRITLPRIWGLVSRIVLVGWYTRTKLVLGRRIVLAQYRRQRILNRRRLLGRWRLVWERLDRRRNGRYLGLRPQPTLCERVHRAISFRNDLSAAGAKSELVRKSVSAPRAGPEISM